MNDFVLFVFVYFFTTTTSCIIMFTIMIKRIYMIRRNDVFYIYLNNDCMLSVLETKYGNVLGVVCVLTNIPVLFFLMFFIMDYLRIKQYYKDKEQYFIKNETIGFLTSWLINRHILNNFSLDNINLNDISFSHYK